MGKVRNLNKAQLAVDVFVFLVQGVTANGTSFRFPNGCWRWAGACRPPTACEPKQQRPPVLHSPVLTSPSAASGSPSSLFSFILHWAGSWSWLLGEATPETLKLNLISPMAWLISTLLRSHVTLWYCTSCGCK
jgi:hypothetical protein